MFEVAQWPLDEIMLQDAYDFILSDKWQPVAAELEKERQRQMSPKELAAYHKEQMKRGKS